MLCRSHCQHCFLLSESFVKWIHSTETCHCLSGTPGGGRYPVALTGFRIGSSFVLIHSYLFDLDSLLRRQLRTNCRLFSSESFPFLLFRSDSFVAFCCLFDQQGLTTFDPLSQGQDLILWLGLGKLRRCYRQAGKPFLTWGIFWWWGGWGKNTSICKYSATYKNLQKLSFL